MALLQAVLLMTFLTVSFSLVAYLTAKRRIEKRRDLD